MRVRSKMNYFHPVFLMPISRKFGLLKLAQIRQKGMDLLGSHLLGSQTLHFSCETHFPRVSMISCVHICYYTPPCVPLGNRNLCLSMLVAPAWC